MLNLAGAGLLYQGLGEMRNRDALAIQRHFARNSMLLVMFARLL
jgi:hypothetical protein